MSTPSPSYYAIITANVRYDNRLSANEKILFAEITALTSKQGYCFASNSYFAKLYNKDIRTIARWINNLSKFNYIQTKIKYKENSKEIEHRLIYPLTIPQEFATPIDKNVSTPHDKNVSTPHDKNVSTPHDKNVLDNILYINSINNNNISIEEIIAYYNQTMNTKLKGDMVIKKNIQTLLKNYTIEDFKLVIDYICHNPWHIENRQATLSAICRTTKFYENLEKAQLQPIIQKPNKTLTEFA